MSETHKHQVRHQVHDHRRRLHSPSYHENSPHHLCSSYELNSFLQYTRACFSLEAVYVKSVKLG